MKRATWLVAVCVTALLALFAGAAIATTPSGATSTLLTRATLGMFEAKNDGIKVKSLQRSADVSVVRVDLAANGGSTGWHYHPGVVMVSVQSGTVTEYDEDCNPSVIQAGRGFVESHDEVHLVRNEGNDAAVLYATFISPTETPALRIDAPQPQNCDKF
jgi:quercetin dioxygenase-like cupin family protein